MSNYNIVAPEPNNEEDGRLATLQINVAEEIHLALYGWTKNLPSWSTTAPTSSLVEEASKAMMDVDQLNAFEESLLEQGSLAYSTATGDLRFLMTFLSEQVLPQTTIQFALTQGWTRLHHAAAQGDCQLIQLLQWNGEDMNVKAFDGSTPICIACEKGHFSAVATLLGIARGITSFSQGKNNVFSSSHQRKSWPYADPTICRYDGTSPLVISCARADAHCVAVLLLAYMLDNWAYQRSLSRRGDTVHRAHALRASEVASILLSFPGRDSLENKGVDAATNHELTPLFLINPLSEPTTWAGVEKWFGVSSVGNRDGVGGSQGDKEDELGKEHWVEETDLFARDVTVGVEISDIAVCAYLRRYQTTTGGASGTGGEQQGPSLNSPASSDDGMPSPPTTPSTSAEAPSENIGDLARSICVISNVEQLAYLSVSTYIEFGGNVVDVSVGLTAPSAIMHSLQVNTQWQENDEKDQDISEHDTDVITSEHQTNSGVVSSSLSSASRTLECEDSLQCSLLDEDWSAAEVAHKLCTEERDQVELASFIAKAALKVKHTKHKKMKSEKKKRYNDILEMKWLKAAPQIGHLSPPPSPKLGSLLKVALLACRPRCVQALLEQIPLTIRKEAINNLFTYEYDAHPEISSTAAATSTLSFDDSSHNKVLIKQQGISYHLRLLAVDGDESLPKEWRGHAGALYGTSLVEDTITDSGEEDSSSSPSSSSASSSIKRRNSKTNLMPSTLSMINSFGVSDIEESDETIKQNSSHRRNKPKLNLFQKCPTKDGVRIGALLPHWPEAWVKWGPDMEAATFESSAHGSTPSSPNGPLSEDTGDIGASTRSFLDHVMSWNEADDMSRPMASINKQSGELIHTGKNVEEESTCRCMLCGVSMTSSDATTHTCPPPVVNPKVGDRVLCFLPDLSMYSSTSISTSKQTKAEDDNVIVWKGQWCAAKVISFHDEEKESKHLREDLAMFFELMETVFESNELADGGDDHDQKKTPVKKQEIL